MRRAARGEVEGEERAWAMSSDEGVWRLRGRRGCSSPDRDEREQREARRASGSWE